MRILNKIIDSYTKEIPFVAYRQPGDTVLKYMSQNSDFLFEFNDFESEGFVFAPFDNKQTAYIINNDNYDEEQLLKTELNFKEYSIPINKIGMKKHIDLVTKTINKINQTELSKVVVSREEKVSLDKFDIVEVFKKMLHQYTNAYVYVWYHPKVGLWMGATPETLLQVNDKSFETMSLAGTQAFNGNLNPVWGVKELEEQKMVSDYIKENLEFKVKSLNFSEVETVKAGDLLHLRTKVKGELKSIKDVESLIDLLHPTPAVCGLPKEKSKEFILKEENYDRTFYTGYLGAINCDNKTSLYVNLRCFNYLKGSANLYVGGGITKSSNAEKEWIETVEKSKTIKRVLF